MKKRERRKFVPQFEIEDYREIMKAELLRRQNLNRYYSLRDFAHDLGMSPSHLSYVLRGKRGLSRAGAEGVADVMYLRGWVRARFIQVVCMTSARSHFSKSAAQTALRSNRFLRQARPQLVASGRKFNFSPEEDLIARRPDLRRILPTFLRSTR